ncbi:MAG TPA: hypothetical protein VN415_00170, partial [Dehalococcoidia bacterium]|nr:hypothetical protein [Dehalococcoidia bacterium]
SWNKNWADTASRLWRVLPWGARLLGQAAQTPHRRARSCLEEDYLMGIRIPNIAVLLLSLGVGALAIYLENMAVAVICISIAAFYATLILWQWKRHNRKG